MEKKKLVIRAIVLPIVLILLIVAAVIPGGGGGISAGAGNGTDAEIESLESLAVLLRGMKTNFSAPAVELTAEVGRLGQDTEVSYESGTVSEISKWDIDYSYSASGTSVSHAMKMNRELTIYTTKDAAYYVSDLNVVASSSTRRENEEAVSSTISLSCLLRIYLEKDVAMLRMDRYAATMDGKVVKDTNKFIGRWIDLTTREDVSVQEVIDGLTGINDENYDVLALMGDFIGGSMEGFTSDSDGTVFTMKEETFRSFLQKVLALAGEPTDLAPGVSGEFVADLYDPAEPKIYFNLKNDFSESVPDQTHVGPFGTTYQTAGYSVRAYTSESDDFTFRNINNTVIGEPDRDDAMTLDEFMEIMEESSNE